MIKLTDNSGNIVAEYEYDAWGNILTQTGTMAASNPFRYAGYMYDEETGLYYLLARYYDAETGRFISRDNVISIQEPLLLNYYIYAYNNPVVLRDPSGNAPLRDTSFKYNPYPMPRTSFEKFVEMSAKIYLQYREAKSTVEPLTNAIKKTVRETNNEKIVFDLMTVGAAASLTNSAWDLNYGVLARMGGSQYIKIFTGVGVVTMLWNTYNLGKDLAELTRDFRRNLEYELKQR